MAMANEIAEETAQFLVGNAGQAALEVDVTLAPNTAKQVLALRARGLTPEQVALVRDVSDARRRARFRFPDADRLYFTGDALAQATSPGIARYHADCLAPFATVLEIGCGVGMDTTMLADAGRAVVAIERDASRLVLARANAQVRGVSDRIDFIHDNVGDGTDNALLQTVLSALDPGTTALYADPSRREGDRRTSQNADRYDPPLSFLTDLAPRFAGGCVKLSPALPDEVLEDFAASVGGHVEFLSEGRECKEACVLWGNAVSAGGNLPRAAVLLPERSAVPAEQDAPITFDLPDAGAFVLDPDPALIRVHALGAIDGASLLSPDDAYLTSETLPAAPRLASAYTIEAVVPYSPRRAGEWLKAAGYGRLVVKKRHFPREPDAVARELKLPNKGREVTLILVRTGSSHLAVFCQPVPAS